MLLTGVHASARCRRSAGRMDGSAKVQIKVTDKHHVWVKREGGMELQILLVKRLPTTETAADPEPAPAKK